MSNPIEEGVIRIPGKVEEVDLSRVGGVATGEIRLELEFEDLTEHEDWLREFMGEGGRVFITEDESYMFVNPEDSEVDFPKFPTDDKGVEIKTRQLMTPEEAEALYKRTTSFLHDLYTHCLGLSVKKKLKEKQFDKLAKKHGLTDLNITPETILSVVSGIDAKQIVEAANLTGQELAELSKETGLTPDQIKSSPWPIVLTQWHLLSVMGSPPNPAFEELYAEPQVQ